MSQPRPLISVGVAVYNGENYLQEALDSILNQTYEDFELLISDNASTDATEQICRSYARQDARVRYHRNDENLGFAPNANSLVHRARGTYFKWADHDDVIAPTYLERCVEALEADPGLVLCHTETRPIDAASRVKRDDLEYLRTDSDDVVIRFRDAVLTWHRCYDSCGVIRRDVLLQTDLFTEHVGSDYDLLAMLALLGRFHRVPEFLFHYREHEEQSIRNDATFDLRDRAVWWDASNNGKLVFPHFQFLVGYAKSIRRAPLTRSERVGCYRILLRWIYENRMDLYHDLRLAAHRKRDDAILLDWMIRLVQSVKERTGKRASDRMEVA